jgi:hypothetical protein
MPVSRSKKKKRKRKKLFDRFKTKLDQEGLLKDKRIIINPPGEEKMSDLLMRFIEPYTEVATTDEAFGKLIAIAVVAWNAAILPPKERKEMIDNIIDSAIPMAKEDAKAIIEQMIKRKEKHFGENRRMILNYQLTETREGRHLAVVSTMPKGDELDET